MRNYMVYFEFLGKKQRIKILAESEAAAYDEVLQKLKIHKIEKMNEEFNQCMDMLDGAINVLKSMPKK